MCKTLKLDKIKGGAASSQKNFYKKQKNVGLKKITYFSSVLQYAWIQTVHAAKVADCCLIYM